MAAARQDQISNLLNKQISGLYRRSQISLNAVPASSASPAAAGTSASGATTPASTIDSDDGGEGTLKTNGQDRGGSVPSSVDGVAALAFSPPAKPEESLKRKVPTASTSAVAASAMDSPNTLKRARASAASSGRSGSSASASASGSVKKSYRPPSARLADLGGISTCIEQVLELIAMPICHPEIYLHTGVRPPRGILLYGPPGCGKTMLAHAIAGEVGVAFISISAPSVVSGMSGESEKTLRETFEEAAKQAPCILFIDEIDAITPKRENAQREMERRIVAQLLTCMDDLSWEKTGNKPVMIIGATNRPDSLDPALRRAGRFDHEIAMGVPDEAAREQILKVQSQKLRLSGDFDFRALAKATPGFVGADLSALTGAAGIAAVKRIFQELGQDTERELRGSAQGIVGTDDNQDSMSLDPPPIENMTLATSIKSLPFDTLPPELQILSIASFLRIHPAPLTPDQLDPLAITNADFQKALTQVQPSSKREGFTTVPDVTWSNVGALSNIRDELRMAIVQPVKFPELFESVGIANPCGVLLWGPPGCGKTLLAKAVANESRANFISVKGPELLNKYVGESERAVRQVFNRAQASSPCIVFFDELDALVPRRDDNLSESSARVVNTLLTELDGLTPRRQVFVIGATNRPDMIDPAMVRPGRLDKLLYVDLPTPDERLEILVTLCRKTPTAPEIDFRGIALDSRCDGFSGADLGALVREAAVTALREALTVAEEDVQPSSASQTFQEMDAASNVVGSDADERQTKSIKQVILQQVHFEKALSKITPSVSHQQRRKYEALRNRFAGIPVGKKRSVADEGVIGEEKVEERAAQSSAI